MTFLDEIGPSLEGLAVLNLLPLFGDAHAIRVTLEGEDQKRLDSLRKALSDSRLWQQGYLPVLLASEGRTTSSRLRLFWPNSYLTLGF